MVKWALWRSSSLILGRRMTRMRLAHQPSRWKAVATAQKEKQGPYDRFSRRYVCAARTNRGGGPAAAARMRQVCALQINRRIGSDRVAAALMMAHEGAKESVPQHFLVAGVFLALGAFDLTALVRAVQGLESWLVTVAFHVVLSAVAAGLLIQRAPRHHGFVLVGILCSLFAGPLAALAFAGVSLLMQSRPSTVRGEDVMSGMAMIAQMKPRDGATILHGQLRDGRARSTHSGRLEHFPSVMKEGALPAKQAILGLIGRKYHPSYFPVLRLALSSADMSVRVQAAAVFTKLRGAFRLQFNQVLASTSIAGDRDLKSTIEKIEVLSQCTASGFLDASELRSARSRVTTLSQALLHRGVPDIDVERYLVSKMAEAEAYDEVSKWLAEQKSRRSVALDHLHVECLMCAGRHQEALALHALVTGGGGAVDSVFTSRSASVAPTDPVSGVPHAG